jgi:RNA polymerase sigma factor (sigma-70 family)
MAAVEVPHAGRARDTTQDLYAQYGKQIYSYCLHKLRSREEAEDAVQTTFLNAFRSLQRGAQTQFEQAWLYKIAQNVCVARQTSSSRRLRLEAPNDFEVLQEVVPAREGDQPLELIGIEEALERMPENQRRAILLREWQGLSYREISDELGLSQAAVEMLIFRARRALAGALEQPEKQGKRGRSARRAGSAGATVAGAIKTLFGGGTAIKAVTIAAAAVAVVGESAQHTIVAPRHAAVASPTIAALGDAPSRAHLTFSSTGAAAVAPAAAVLRHVAPAPVHHVSHSVSTPAAPAAHVAAAEPDVETPAPPAEPAPAPAPAPPPAPVAAPPVTVATVAPEVATAPPPAVPADQGQTTSADPAANPPGNAYGLTKHDADPPAAPVTPASGDPQGNGNGNAYGHDEADGNGNGSKK